jgi:hypothetical protein
MAASAGAHAACGELVEFFYAAVDGELAPFISP